MTTSFQNVDVGDINKSDVTNWQAALNDKLNELTSNSYLSISDVGGLTTALENLDIGDINISDVINLQTAF